MGGTENRIVVITGATRGLGRAMTAEFMKLGHTVLGCGRSEKLIGDLRRAFPTPHEFQRVDVASDAAVQEWAAALLSRHGPPELLINNAAVITDPAPLWETPAAAFSEIVDVNIKGIANVIRHFVPAMVAKRRGVIVNLSSGWGRSTDPNVAPYCATKWAVEGLTQAFAQELPAGMAAVALSPGMINTDMLQRCFGAEAASHADPEEWATRAVPFILKLGAKDNGQSLSVPH